MVSSAREKGARDLTLEVRSGNETTRGIIFSEKDGEVHHFDLCESCYDELVGGFRIPVDVEEQTELL